jgi:tRNA-dihydrouridine synthase
MMAVTGCDGVVIGRGCLGRPWLFANLEAACDGRWRRERPDLGFVLATIRRHAELLVEHRGSEEAGVIELRGHMTWYLKGYPVGAEARAAAHAISSLADLEALSGRLDPAMPYPGPASEGRRGRAGGTKRVRLPDGWLASRH